MSEISQPLSSGKAKPRMGVAPPSPPTIKVPPKPTPRKSVDIAAVKSKFESPPKPLLKPTKKPLTPTSSVDSSQGSVLSCDSHCVNRDKLDKPLSDSELRRSLKESKPVIANFLEGLTAEIKSDEKASSVTSSTGSEKMVVRFSSANKTDVKSGSDAEKSTSKSRKTSRSTFYTDSTSLNSPVKKSGKSMFFVENERIETKSTFHNDVVISSTVLSLTKKSYTLSAADGDETVQSCDESNNQVGNADSKSQSTEPDPAKSPKPAKRILTPPKTALSTTAIAKSPSPQKPSVKTPTIPSKPAALNNSPVTTANAEDKPVPPLRRNKQKSECKAESANKDADSKSQKMRITSFTTEDTDIFERECQPTRRLDIYCDSASICWKRCLNLL